MCEKVLNNACVLERLEGVRTVGTPSWFSSKTCHYKVLARPLGQTVTTVKGWSWPSHDITTTIPNDNYLSWLQLLSHLSRAATLHFALSWLSDQLICLRVDTVYSKALTSNPNFCYGPGALHNTWMTVSNMLELVVFKLCRDSCPQHRQCIWIQWEDRKWLVVYWLLVPTDYDTGSKLIDFY